MNDRYKPVHLRTFTIGKQDEECLEASLTAPDADERFAKERHICIVYKLDTLKSCLIDPESSEENFGSKLLYAFINILKANYPYITKIRLNDTSFLPCNRPTKDSLDLYTYNISLYGKTWYEMKFGAYLESAVHQTNYNAGIFKYMSASEKEKVPWISFYFHIEKYNSYATEKISERELFYEEMYNASSTFPIFMRKLKETIKKSERCKFFKSWLEMFIYLYVPNERYWMFDIDVNPVLGNVLNVRSARPMGSRQRRKTRRNNQCRKT